MSYSSGEPLGRISDPIDSDAIELTTAADSASVDEHDVAYAQDQYDRTGLPVIPTGRVPAGDTIDIGAITREYDARAVRRSSPLAGGVPLRSINSTGQPDDEPLDEEDEFAYEAPERRATHKKLPKKSVQRAQTERAGLVASRASLSLDSHSLACVSLFSLVSRTFFTAIFLLAVGVVFSTLGLTFVFTLGMSEALPFLIIGGIGFIPGSYVSFIIYHTWRGTPGFSYDQIPSYDD